MGLFDLFSNDTAEAAARQRNQGLQQGYDALTGSYGQGRDAINSEYGLGREALTGNYSAGINSARDAYGNAGNIYAGLGDYFKQQYGGGANAYGDATGANGAEGTARARAAFQADPGHNFSLDQGLQALQRTHAAAGNLNSGNADTDTLKFAQGLADQSYGSYVSRLAPYLSLAGQGATASAAGQADAYSHLGNTVNSDYTQLGNATNASFIGQGAGLNANYTGQGTAANTNYTGQGASDAAATMNNYNIGQNQLSALKSGVGLAANLFGGFG